MKKSKICIGTSNFAKSYGINNNKFKKKDLKNLFKFLITKKILFLDCADGYNNFEKFAHEIKKFKIRPGVGRNLVVAGQILKIKVLTVRSRSFNF